MVWDSGRGAEINREERSEVLHDISGRNKYRKRGNSAGQPLSSLVVSESRHKVNKNACGTKLEEQGQG